MSLTKTRTAFLLVFGLLSCMQAFNQNSLPVKGVVTDQYNAPVVAATVQIVGTKKAVLTDGLGVFLLTAPADAILEISSVGHASVRVHVQAVMAVVLQTSESAMNDVVVIGYGTQKKKELTGSIATVTSKDFQQGAITTPEQLIAGKVAGVSITSNGGSPGAGSVIRIRGGASLNASNDPLIVIDGVPLSGNNIYGASNPLSTINPNDIETFTVLKDAAATAIYGSRASNGVILITTKKGTGGKPVVSFSTQVSVSKIQKTIDVLSAAQFRTYVDSLGTGTYDNVHSYKSLLGTASTNWQNQIYQSALSTDNNISVAGAYKTMPYRVSLGYLDQDGILKTDNLQRFSGGISLSPRLLDNHLKIDLNLKGSVSKARFANGAAISSAVYFDPTQPVTAASPFGNYYEWAAKDPVTGNITLNKLAPRNPLALLELYNNSSTVQRSYGNIQFDYSFHFLPELHANLNLGYDVASGNGTTNVPAYAAQNYLDSGQHNKYANRISNKVGEFYLNYTKELKSIHSNINATAGYGYYNNLSINYNYPNLRANGDTIPGSIPSYPKDEPENTLISYYARLIYTFHTKYILAASIRSDGSSRFAPDNRWGTFPSLALTWRINQENLFSNSRTLSDLKLRLSYGITGNQDGIYDYPYLGVYSLSDNASRVQFGNTFYNMATPAAYDASIRWEQTATSNAGLDFGFFQNRLNGSLDVYYKKTKDLLNTIPIPEGSNFSSTILTNVGNLENKGVEFAVNVVPIKNKNLTWTLGFNVAYNQNKITNLTATKDPTYPGTLTGNGVVQINTVGYNTNSFYVYHQLYNKSGKPIEGVYQDLNGDGIINQNDLYHYKTPFPPYVFGFSTQVNWKQWSLSTVLRANVGNYLYNGVSTGAIESNILNPLVYLANSMTDVLNTHFYNSQPQSDYYVQNASFLKMDNLGLGYDAGRILHDKVGLRLGLNCQNVFTVTKYTGIDPEIYGGIDNTIYPRPRIYVLSARLQF
ncbi:MAG TPA: TonB-dependent receptor [Chitinophagaceae bacterium]